MALAAADERKPEKAQRALYYLTSGRDQVYRLRMKYTGRDAIVYREDMDITPEKESFEKTGQGPIRVIDLSRMSGTDLTASVDLQIFPNPSTDRVTIIVAGAGLTPTIIRGRALHMDIADAIGNVIMTSPVTFGEAVDVQGLPTGAYVVRVRLEGTMVAVTGRFTVIR